MAVAVQGQRIATLRQGQHHAGAENLANLGDQISHRSTHVEAPVHLFIQHDAAGGYPQIRHGQIPGSGELDIVGGVLGPGLGGLGAG